MPVEQELVIITPVEKHGKPYITEDGQVICGLPTAPDCRYKGISDIKAYLCHFAICLYSGKYLYYFRKLSCRNNYYM